MKRSLGAQAAARGIGSNASLSAGQELGQISAQGMSGRVAQGR